MLIINAYATTEEKVEDKRKESYEKWKEVLYNLISYNVKIALGDTQKLEEMTDARRLQEGK